VARCHDTNGFRNVPLVPFHVLCGGEIARLELGLKHVGLERTRYGFFTGSNVPENLNILRFETDFNELDVRNSAVARRVRWKQLMREHAGKIDLELAKRTYRCFYNGGIAGASEIPQRMVASGDSRPGRAALGSCESESWRSGTLRSRRWSRDEGFRAGRYYAAAKGCGWGQRPNSWTESSPFSHVGKAVTLGGGRG